MNNSNQNRNNHRQEKPQNAFPGIEFNYSRSKEEAWEQLSEMMEQHTPLPKVKTLHAHWLRIAVAAIIFLMLGSATFMRLYTKTLHAPAGQHLTAILPDGSAVELNASSVIKYKPYWWRFNRHVQFEGEAFFTVSKGKKFEVVSARGRTIVLGTSFNIYARKDQYKVTCYTGKVRVVSIVNGQSADITPNKQAYIKSDGSIALSEKVEPGQTISWRNDMFIFTRTPLSLVFEEIERQYGISISTHENLNYLYSGNFTRERSAEEVVRMICRSLNLDYKPVPGGFLVSKQAIK